MRGLEDDSGNWISDDNGVMRIVPNYFCNIFTTSEEEDNEAIFEKISLAFRVR